MLVVNGHTTNTVVVNNRATTGILNGQIIWGLQPGPTFTGSSVVKLGFDDPNINWTLSVNKYYPASASIYKTILKSDGISSVTVSSHATAKISLTASSYYAVMPSAPTGLASSVVTNWGKSGTTGVVTASFSGVLSDSGFIMQDNFLTGRKCIKIVSNKRTSTANTASSTNPWLFNSGVLDNNHLLMWPSYAGAISATSFISSTSNPYVFLYSGTGLNGITAASAFGNGTFVEKSGSMVMKFNSARSAAFSANIYTRTDYSSNPPYGGFVRVAGAGESTSSASGVTFSSRYTGSPSSYSLNLNATYKTDPSAVSSFTFVPRYFRRHEQYTSVYVGAVGAVKAYSGQWSASANPR